MELVDYDVGRDRTALEVHGEDDHEGEELHEHGSLSGKDVCRDDREDEVEGGSDDHDEDRVHVTCQDTLVLEYHLIAVKRRLDGMPVDS